MIEQKPIIDPFQRLCTELREVSRYSKLVYLSLLEASRHKASIDEALLSTMTGLDHIDVRLAVEELKIRGLVQQDRYSGKMKPHRFKKEKNG